MGIRAAWRGLKATYEAVKEYESASAKPPDQQEVHEAKERAAKARSQKMILRDIKRKRVWWPGDSL